LNDIEKEYVDSGKELSFFEDPRFEEVDIKSLESKHTELKNALSRKAHVQDVVDLYEQLSFELSKLSDMALLRESYYHFSFRQDSIFREIKATTNTFGDYLVAKLDEFEGQK